MKLRSAAIGRIAAALALLLPCGCGGGAVDKRTEITVFAAASLKDVVTEIGQAYEKRHAVKLVYNFAGSNTLAEQIAAAPKADLFLSASEEWMDYVQDRGRILADTRRVMLSNRLVVVARSDSSLEVNTPEDLCALPFKHLALGDPAAVPAGKYAKAWLETKTCGAASLWESVYDRVLPAPDVRFALGHVESDRTTLGIVYKTDAAISGRVKVVFDVPPEEGPEITYAAAVLAGRPHLDETRAFQQFLASPMATEIFVRFGFEPAASAEAADG